MLLPQDFNHVNLTVVIENERVSQNDLVDRVYISIAKNTFSESEEYLGMYGIATITLGYCLSIPTKGSSAAAEQGQYHFLF